MEIDLDVVAQSVDVARMLQRKFMLGHFSAIRLPMDSDAAVVEPNLSGLDCALCSVELLAVGFYIFLYICILYFVFCIILKHF